MEFDYIVVGAGTAGCVLAARLSERPDCRVLLVEAGPDITPDLPSVQSPFPISHGVPAFRWPGLTAHIKAPLGNGRPAPAMPFLQARMLGGGGNLMGMIALRGAPADYDEWRDEGASGWGWQDVLPYFRRLERDHDFADALHGDQGPIPIRRYERQAWPPFVGALGDAFERDGFPFLPDANGAFRDGHIAIPHSSLPDRRVSSAVGYLDGKTRARPNLKLLTDTEVDSLLIEAQKVEGIRISTPEGSASYRAREVILCGGAIGSPQLLLRSGIGPASELSQLGLVPVHDLPGVGKNLYNHPIIYISALLPRIMRRPRGALIYNALRYSSDIADCPPHDMLMPIIHRTAWHALGDCISAIGVSVYKSASRGCVSLVKQGDRFAPKIELGLFSDHRDLLRLVAGFKRIYRYLMAASQTGAAFTPFVPTNMKLMAKLADPRASHGALAWLIARAFDGPGILRRHALKQAGLDPATLMHDENRLIEFVHTHSSTMFHPAGTCRIGARTDPRAVVDERCRVIGMGGLRVADASVMPSIVRANTNIPTIMIAEKAADMIREDSKLHEGTAQ